MKKNIYSFLFSVIFLNYIYIAIMCDKTQVSGFYWKVIKLNLKLGKR